MKKRIEAIKNKITELKNIDNEKFIKLKNVNFCNFNSVECVIQYIDDIKINKNKKYLIYSQVILMNIDNKLINDSKIDYSEVLKYEKNINKIKNEVINEYEKILKDLSIKEYIKTNRKLALKILKEIKEQEYLFNHSLMFPVGNYDKNKFNNLLEEEWNKYVDFCKNKFMKIKYKKEENHIEFYFEILNKDSIIYKNRNNIDYLIDNFKTDKRFVDVIRKNMRKEDLTYNIYQENFNIVAIKLSCEMFMKEYQKIIEKIENIIL